MKGKVARMREIAVAMLALLLGGAAFAQNGSFVLERDGRVISLVPYAPNILRVTMSRDKTAALSGPGYGIIAEPNAAGWTRDKDAAGNDVYRSARMVVHVMPGSQPQHMPLDALNTQLREIYFGAGNVGSGPREDEVEISTSAGKSLVDMRSWSMERTGTEPAGAAQSGANGPGANRAGTEIPTYLVGSVFDSGADEHYYGLGQQQQGWMDLRDHQIKCWHDYGAPGGESVCVPFMVSSRGYGLLWDNPSKTTVNLGFNGRNTWSSEVGDRVSYFVIAGETSDEIYGGYRLLTGVTHMLPRGIYGYIQSKAIYPTQEQALAIAKGYRDRKLPLDGLVVDFLNMTRQGEMDLDLKRWPDPAAMNKELNSMGIHTLLSVWPHYAPGTQFYDMLKDKGWFISTRDGKPDQGWGRDVIGPNLDTTNPEAGRWFWDKIRDRYVKPDGFDYIWLDETEPDYDPENDMYFVGSGRRYYNIYPLFHTASVYEGFRRDFGDSRRVMILARAAYTGAQRNGTVFWSSDIQATWDMLKRSVPAGLNFAATGLPYWDTDIAGFFAPTLPADYHAAHKPLIDGSDAVDNIANYEDYPELFVRWFEWGAFQPVMRAHGERKHNEVWAYGKQAEPILAKYLRLRYTLLPYTYSAAYKSYQTGAPYMRALFMDFPNDPKAVNIADEYMYGPAFLVAPVTEQGATKRTVYLPAGCDWYNNWTNERMRGGQTIEADAPIDALPLFVRAGSIVPLGSEVLSADEPQSIASVRVYPGANGSFTLFQDDGKTYAYEKGAGAVTKLIWNDASHRLTHEGPAAWSGPDASVVTVVGK